MNSRKLIAVVAIVVCLLLAAAVIVRLSLDPNQVAELLDFSGKVERDFSEERVWQTASIGAGLSFGDGLRTLTESRAALAMIDNSEVHLTPETTIRFLPSPPGSTSNNLEVIKGEANVEVGTEPLLVTSEFGVVKIEPGSRSTMLKTKDGYIFQVSFGRAIIAQDSEGNHIGKPIEEGEQLTLEFGVVVVEKIEENTTDEEDGAESVEVATEDSPSADTSTDTDTQDTQNEPPSPAKASAPLASGFKLGTQPAKADFGAEAGQSLVAHSVHVPVVVEFNLGDKCPSSGQIRVSKTKSVYSFENGRARIPFKAGRTHYNLHCKNDEGTVAKKATKRGWVAVRKDSGQAPLAGRTPPSVLSADGRNYTIIYQARLPKITLVWPGAAADNQYTLHVATKGRGTKQFQTSGPKHVFKPGTLPGGEHTLKFVSNSTGRASRKTNLTLGFDHETPIAVIEEPAPGTFHPSQTVNISGVAAPGWKVSVSGEDLTVNGKNRFSGRINYTGEYGSIAIRLKHRRLGTHYYLRRAVK